MSRSSMATSTAPTTSSEKVAAVGKKTVHFDKESLVSTTDGGGGSLSLEPSLTIDLEADSKEDGSLESPLKKMKKSTLTPEDLVAASSGGWASLADFQHVLHDPSIASGVSQKQEQ